jgi:hypothetical protein
MRHRSAPILLLALLAACVSPEMRDGHQVVFRADAMMVQNVLPYDADVVWSVVPQAYEDLGLTVVRNRNAPGREYMTPQLRVRDRLYGMRNSEFIDCGSQIGGSLEEIGEVTLALITRVDPVSGGTAVRTQMNAYARRRDVSAQPVWCPSRGVLEQAVAESIQARLAAGGAPRVGG